MQNPQVNFNQGNQFPFLNSAVSADALKPKKLAINIRNGVVFNYAQEIMKVESAGNYCIIYTVNDQIFETSKPLKFFQNILDVYGVFFRIHKSYIINLNYVKICNKEMNYVELEDGSRAEISRRKMSF